MHSHRLYSLTSRSICGRSLAALAALGFLWTAPTVTVAATSELVIDTVVASVNDLPITLSDLTRRLGSAKPLTTQEAATDPRARQALDSLIFERLIEAEAASRKMTVSDAEVDRYVDEIAKRNNLSVDAFKKALAEEKRDFTEYRRQVKSDILRSRITGAVMQSGVAVTEAEVERFIAEHPEFARSGAKLKLRQIVLTPGARTDEDALRILNEAKDRIEGGEDFRTVAAVVSDGPEKNDGGLIGVVAEKDLSPEIFDAVFALKSGEVSAVTRTAQGYHLFWVDERFADDNDAENTRLLDDVRRTLQEEKKKQKLESYFTTELYKAHSVDKKI